ncbi:MAG: hypothetical protein QXF15_01310 [Candidatus Aenigmatarchaeota archaeon]|nr:hypothetical protein [Candidatus Aenigmarchaeota archaeon]
MFLVIGEDKCPFCGISGKVIKNTYNINIYFCPLCKTKFNEFGIIENSNITSEINNNM